MLTQSKWPMTSQAAEANAGRKTILLRAEGASLLAISVLLYWIGGASWLLFALRSSSPTSRF